ncbi:RagB/SusD family nutrient uptake outer membrane protein [Chitinophaga solisilvae]|uniref:RagB/SusD family nutrient uptake outer membrane protein n=1 Tax=Chitinophaga solisilvae TaxID=1233460 RepID=UPI0013715373|nr:RagB/SusD family nutrient uptake outer membrane protein [Chitinophaga solisilvae]
MKKILLIAGIAAAAGLLGSCNKMLNEKPYSVLTADFYKTSQGVNAALDASYAGMRTVWGCEDYFSLTTPGTDEFKRGNDGNNVFMTYDPGLLASDGKFKAQWNNIYTYINTCNAVIEFGPSAPGLADNIRKKAIAEARFLRANYYFVLVQFWGDVTLTQSFISSPLTSASRDPLAKVYEAIIKDLKDAIPDLPPGPKGIDFGRANALAAKHVLARVYLTRAGSKAAQGTDYRDAATYATDAISTASGQGVNLLPDFGSIFTEGNEANAEVLWSVQHTASLAYNGSPQQDNRTPDNMLVHLFVPQYEKVDGMTRNIRDGRPYIRCVPTKWLTDTVFAERVNDTRFNKSFQTVWFCNNASSIPKWPNPLPPGAPAGAVAGGPKMKLGDTCIYMPQGKRSSAQIAAAPYTLMPSDKYSIKMSPAISKYVDTKRSDMNAPSIRPIIAYRLAETYLIAAEALMQSGRTGEAVQYINAIRERAAYPTGDKTKMTVTAADLNINFILDERSRELAGENIRWLDLARTGKLAERIRAHNDDDSRVNFKEPKHLLRPIPQDQIDATTTGTPYPQNPGWIQ